MPFLGITCNFFTGYRLYSFVLAVDYLYPPLTCSFIMYDFLLSYFSTAPAFASSAATSSAPNPSLVAPAAVTIATTSRGPTWPSAGSTAAAPVRATATGDSASALPEFAHIASTAGSEPTSATPMCMAASFALPDSGSDLPVSSTTCAVATLPVPTACRDPAESVPVLTATDPTDAPPEYPATLDVTPCPHLSTPKAAMSTFSHEAASSIPAESPPLYTVTTTTMPVPVAARNPATAAVFDDVASSTQRMTHEQEDVSTDEDEPLPHIGAGADDGWTGHDSLDMSSEWLEARPHTGVLQAGDATSTSPDSNPDRKEALPLPSVLADHTVTPAEVTSSETGTGGEPADVSTDDEEPLPHTGAAESDRWSGREPDDVSADLPQALRRTSGDFKRVSANWTQALPLPSELADHMTPMAEVASSETRTGREPEDVLTDDEEPLPHAGAAESDRWTGREPDGVSTDDKKPLPDTGVPQAEDTTVTSCDSEPVVADWKEALPLLSELADHTTTAAEAADLKAYFRKHPRQLQAADEGGNLPLHLTVLSQRGKHAVTMVAALIELCSEAVEHRDVTGKLPLHCAAKHQQGKYGSALVDVLLTAQPHGAKEQDNEGHLPLHIAAAQQSGVHAAAIVTSLLSAYPEAVQQQTHSGELPLHFAVLHQKGTHGVAVVNALLSAHPQATQQKNKQGTLPLHIAAEHQKGKHALVVITSLLTVFPQAAQLKDKDGRLPADIALNHNSSRPAACKSILREAAEGRWRPSTPGACFSPLLLHCLYCISILAVFMCSFDLPFTGHLCVVGAVQLLFLFFALIPLTAVGTSLVYIASSHAGLTFRLDCRTCPSSSDHYCRRPDCDCP